MPADMTLDGAGDIRISGDLVFATVGDLLGRGRQLIDQNPGAVVDLSAVVRCDSAGLALLLEWVAEGAAAADQAKFRALPDALLAIARLSNVEGLLPRV